jgi:hypothetical protein
MDSVIPAAPGWYVSSRGLDALYPVIAWTPAVDLDGGAVLLPYVPVGTGMPPELLDLKAFPRDGWQVIYLPNHDPATGVRPNEEQS